MRVSFYIDLSVCLLRKINAGFWRVVSVNKKKLYVNLSGHKRFAASTTPTILRYEPLTPDTHAWVW